MAGRPRNKNKPSRRRGNIIETHAEAYYANTPEGRMNQLANLNYLKRSKRRPVPKLDIKALEKTNIIDFAVNYLGVSFKERPGQEVVLRSLYGLPLDEPQRALYRKLTGNDDVFEPNVEKTEADLAIGARGGKSFMVSVIALYEAIVKGSHWRKFVREGEVARAVITATRQKQCEDIIQASCTTMLENSPLKCFIAGEPLQAELSLTNGLTIASFPCNSTAARGLPIFLLIFDEIAHYRVEGPKADETIHNALLPRQAQFPGAKCLKISTPAAKQGLFWNEFDEGFKVTGRLTVQAPTRMVNPVIPQEFIDKEYKRDPINARREFGAEFSETVEGFFEGCMDELDSCFGIDQDVPFVYGNEYHAAIDQSGLSGRDAWAFTICHQDNLEKKIVQDVTRSWDTKNIAEIIADSVELCANYHIGVLTADRYAGGIVESLFNNRGIEVMFREDLAVIYKNFKTLVISGKVLLQNDGRLKRGLKTTQAFYGKSQRLSIVHERTREGHSDIADATVSAVYDCSIEYTVTDFTKDIPVTTSVKEDDKCCAYDVYGL